MSIKMVWQKLCACVVALALISSQLGTPKVASAASFSGNETTSYTISGIQQGDKVSVYKFIQGAYDSATNALSYNWVTGFNPSDPSLETYLGYVGTSTEQSDVAKAVGNILAENTGSLVQVASDVAAGADGNVTVENLGIGSYYVVVKPAQTSAQSSTTFYSNLVFNVMPTTDDAGNFVAPAAGSVAVKKSTIEISKTVNADKYTEGKDEYATAATGITNGDVVSFKIVSSLPNVLQTDKNQSVTIVDTTGTNADGSNLFGSVDNVTVSIQSGSTTKTLTEGSDYTLGNASGSSILSVTINNLYKYANTLGAPPTVTITYDATFAATDGMTTYSNANTAAITYNTDANQASELTTSSSPVSVTTYGLSFVKVDATDTNTKLSGASFDIYEPDATGTDSITYDGAAVTVRKVGSATSDDNGYVVLKNLGTGTYYAVETAAPEGYSLSTTVKKMEITAEGATVTGTSAATGTQDQGTFTNIKVPLLPITGGAGTVLFTVCGIALIAFAWFIFALKRKKDNEEETA